MNLSLLGERIKFTRTDQKLTLEKLSERVGISRNFLWEIEAGRKAPAIQTLHNICKELRVSADYLFGFSSKNDYTNDAGGKPSETHGMIDFLNEDETLLLYELLKTYREYGKRL